MTSSKSRSPSRSRSRSRKRREYERVRIAQIVEERLAEVTRDLQRTFLRMKTLKETGIRTPADEKTAEKLMEDELKYKCDRVLYQSTKNTLNKLKNYETQKQFVRTVDDLVEDNKTRQTLAAFKRAKTSQEKESLLKKAGKGVLNFLDRHKGKIATGAAVMGLGYLANTYGLPINFIGNTLSAASSALGKGLQAAGTYLNPQSIANSALPVVVTTAATTAAKNVFHRLGDWWAGSS